MNGAPRRSGRGPVRVGFVGAGNVLPAYLQALDRLVGRGWAEAGAVVARSEAARAALARLRPGLRTVPGDDELLLADADVEVVVVLTPPATHSELTRRLLAGGRHVVCEKPLADDSGTATELFRTAEESGLVLLAAPFVHLSPTFRRLWSIVADGEIGRVHAARAHYGNPGSTWSRWYHEDPLATLGDVGVYNLKSLAALLGPVREVTAVAATALPERRSGDEAYAARDPDTWQLILRHEQGALASVLASHATHAYRRPAIELYGSAGTANLLGDDWDPHGLEVWREDAGAWELREPDDATWLWTDGLREAVEALRTGRPPLAHPDLDVHLIDVIAAAGASAAERRPVSVTSRFEPWSALRPAPGRPPGHVHDRTRPADEQ
jgi:predicted dehydrogenase